MQAEPKIINGNLRADERGAVKFFNNFNFETIKRFYQVENIDLKTIRAFHGHMKEAKYVYVVSGSIIFCAVFLDDKKSPSKQNKVDKFILKAEDSEILYIPPSY